MFSSFVLPDSFSAVPRASGLVFMFCAPRFIFDRTEGVRSPFLIVRSRIHFGRYRRRWVPCSCFALADSSWALPMACAPFSCFALPDSFSTVSGASGHVLLFCAPGVILGCTDGAEPRFHVLRSLTRFHVACSSSRGSSTMIPAGLGTQTSCDRALPIALNSFRG
jgi:hypothetical protein